MAKQIKRLSCEGETRQRKSGTSIQFVWKRGLPVALALLSSVFLFEKSAAAQESSAESDLQVIEEIVVTARRKEENVQDVPMTVTALTPLDLERQNITKPNDLMYTVPSLTVAPVVNTFLIGYSLRSLPRGVTTYFGESSCCFGLGVVPFLDLQSVQALNGPQGTLFGRSSSAGAILLEPVRPDATEMDGFVKARFGEYGRQEFIGAVNVPVIEDQLAVRLAVHSIGVDGYTEMIGSSKTLDDEDSRQIRLGINFTSGRFTNYTAASYIELDQSANGVVLTATNPNAGLLATPDVFLPFVFSGAFGGPCGAAVAAGFNPDDASCVAQRSGLFADMKAALIAGQGRIDAGGDSAFRKVPAPVSPAFAELEDWSILNVTEFSDVELGRVNLGIKNVFSFEARASNTSSHIDGIGGLILNAVHTADAAADAGSNNTSLGGPMASLGPKTETVNNDVNVNLDVDDGLLSSTLGFYYSRHEAPSANGTSNLFQVFSGLFHPLLGFDSAVDFNDSIEGSERAWYTQSTLDASKFSQFPINGLTFTAGYRKSWNKDSSAGFTPVLDLATGTLVAAGPRNENKTRSDDYNYLFSITQQFTDNVMVYISTNRAYTPGGVNPAIQGFTNLPSASPTFGPEIVETWEVGTKLDFYLGEVPVRLNAAIYQYEFDDIQVRIVAMADSGTIVSYNANAAAAEFKGFELSGSILPIDNLEISFAYSYSDSEYTKWEATDPVSVAVPGDALCLPNSTPQNCLLDLSNNPFVNSPEHQGHITVAYQLPFDESVGSVTVSANLYAQSRVWFDTNAARTLEVMPTVKELISQKSYHILNLRADWVDIVGSGIDAAFFINNATDELYATGKSQSLSSLGYAIGTFGAPRMWGLEVSKHF